MFAARKSQSTLKKIKISSCMIMPVLNNQINNQSHLLPKGLIPYELKTRLFFYALNSMGFSAALKIGFLITKILRIF